MSLVFDFWRKVGQDANAKCGGVVHYYDEQAQDIFLNSGIKTRLTTPKDGQWNTAELSASQFVNQIHYTQLTLDHPANGTLYMAAILPNGGVDFLRYQYAADLSDIAEVTYSAQIDNPVTEISAQIENISNEWYYISTVYDYSRS